MLAAYAEGWALRTGILQGRKGVGGRGAGRRISEKDFDGVSFMKAFSLFCL